MLEPATGAISRVRTFFADCPIPQQRLEYVCKVTETGDGDTCTVAIEEPDGRTWFVNLRYESASAPEMTERGGRQTSDFNKQLLAGQWGILKTRGRRDQRSRLLGDLFMWSGKGVPLMDVSAAINRFVLDNGYGTGN